MTGASDDDPSGIATYSQAGAAFRFGLLWTALLTLPLMATVEEICDRTALATGRGLGELTRMRFRSWRPAVALLVGALLVANSMNIAADLVAVGSGMNLLHAGPVWLWSLAAGLGVIVGLVAGRFALLERLFKGLCLGLLAYVCVVVLAGPDWGGVLRATFVPQIRIDRGYLALVIAVLGTTISPYLFFWQSAHRVEELREAPEGGDHAVRSGTDPRAGRG